MRFRNGRRGTSPVTGFIGGGPIVRTRPNSSDDEDALSVVISGSTQPSVQGPQGNRIYGTMNVSSPALGATTDDGFITNGPTLRYFVDGTVGNNYILFVASGSVNTGSIVDGPGPSTTFKFVSGVTTVADFRNRITSGSTFIRLFSDGTVPLNTTFDSLDDGLSINFGGGVDAVPGLLVTSSFYLESSVSMGRGYERRKLDAILLGKSAARVDQKTFPFTPVIDSVATGNFERPSWTRSYAGPSRAFVQSAITSSDQENISFNTFISGIESIESSAVPAFRVVHSKKPHRFQTITVKKTASFFDTVATQFNSSSAFFPPKSFVASSGSLVSEMSSVPVSVSGSSVIRPCVVTIDVPVNGRLVDIKVWVELQHESSSNTFKYTPLGCLGLALRSPNVSWNGFGSPIENDPLIASIPVFDTGFDTHPEFWKNSFVLWEGAGFFSSINPDPSLLFDTKFATPAIFSNFSSMTSSALNANPKWFSMFTSWDRDLSIRTVFSDGASVPNPRMNYSSNLSGNFNGAPNANSGINSPWGLGVNWTGSTGSPPAGWLTGPGGVASVNEWPTTGVNNGASAVRPLYPLLDPVFQSIPSAAGVTLPLVMDDGITPINYNRLAGFRPGLRGSEISGTWKLLIAAGSQNQDDLFRLWFKQLRLEITYETGLGGSRFRSGFNARRPGDSFLYSVSGTAGSGFLTATLNTFTTVPEQNSISRTFGVVGNSGSVNRSAALLYRLTGSLADIVGPTPSWLFRGPGGMPIIPESSASLVPIVAQQITSTPFSDFLQPRRDLDLPQRLADVASDANAQVRLRDLAAAFVSSSAT